MSYKGRRRDEARTAPRPGGADSEGSSVPLLFLPSHSLVASTAHTVNSSCKYVYIHCIAACYKLAPPKLRCEQSPARSRLPACSLPLLSSHDLEIDSSPKHTQQLHSPEASPCIPKTLLPACYSSKPSSRRGATKLLQRAPILAGSNSVPSEPQTLCLL